MTLTLAFQGHSRSSTKVPLDSPYMGFLLMFNSNIEPNEAPLRDIRLQNLGDLAFDLSGSLKVKCNGVVGLRIYDFLIHVVSNSNYLCNLHRLGVIATWKFFSYLLSSGPNFGLLTPTLTSHWQIVAPQPIRTRIFQACHHHKLAAHQGVVPTLALIKRRFYWPNMQKGPWVLVSTLCCLWQM